MDGLGANDNCPWAFPVFDSKGALRDNLILPEKLIDGKSFGYRGESLG